MLVSYLCCLECNYMFDKLDIYERPHGDCMLDTRDVTDFKYLVNINR